MTHPVAGGKTPGKVGIELLTISSTVDPTFPLGYTGKSRCRARDARKWANFTARNVLAPSIVNHFRLPEIVEDDWLPEDCCLTIAICIKAKTGWWYSLPPFK
jgi:hypothetical protein